MKKISAKPTLLLLCLLSVALLLQGCVKKNTDGNTPTQPATQTVNDYFPMKENVHYVYEGVGNEFAGYDVWNEYIEGNKIQQRVDNGGTVTTKIYELNNGVLTRIFSQEETYYRENLLDVAAADPEVLLMDPIKVGTRWTLADGRIRSIVSTNVRVSVPMGSYDAIQVITEDPKNASNNTNDYYVKDIGLVKTVFSMAEMEISSSLKEISENVFQTQTVQFYYPDIDTETYTVIAKDLNFHTNDVTADILAEAYKQAPGGNLNAVFSKNTKINTLTRGIDGRVLLDLTGAFETEMNAGSGYESMILQSIANTFGAYYNQAPELVLTIEGKPYSSGHYEFQEGEGIPAIYDATQ